MRTRLIGLTAIAAAIATTVGVAPAIAATPSEIHAFAVTNSIAGQDGKFVAAALVESKSKKCIRGRKIQFSRDGESLGSAKTDKNGEAFRKIGDSAKPGTYKARMKKDGNCGADTTTGKLAQNGTFTPK